MITPPAEVQRFTSNHICSHQPFRSWTICKYQAPHSVSSNLQCSLSANNLFIPQTILQAAKVWFKSDWKLCGKKEKEFGVCLYAQHS